MAAPHPTHRAASSEHQGHTPSSQNRGKQASRLQAAVSSPETITVPDLKRLYCLFSTFLLLSSPTEISEIKSSEVHLVMAGKVGALPRVPLASLSGSVKCLHPAQKCTGSPPLFVVIKLLQQRLTHLQELAEGTE